LVRRSLPWLVLVLAALSLAVAFAAPAASQPAATASAGRCLGMKATIVSGSATITGTKAPDAIVVKGAGDHAVNGLGGNDRICGGPGNDRLNGGQGNDALEGGGGNDTLLGDKGNDRAAGGSGDDAIEGGAGDDDPLEGGPGADSVIGGTGTDAADGGGGDGDVVRGDAGPDSLSGGSGTQDIVSYASATRRGVTVDLMAGKSKGDGHDSLNGFEDAVGSPQGDTLVGGAGSRLDGGVGDDTLLSGGAGEAFGGPGTDSCKGFALEHSCGAEAVPPANAAYVVLNQGLAGSSLIVQGGPAADQLRISSVTGTWVVADSDRVVAGEGCASGAAGQVVCPEGGGAALVVATGGTGDDTVAIDPSVSATVSVRINGNAGNDTLQGGTGDDVLEAGENYKAPDSGIDTLEGNGGSDVLYADPGADALRGGPGNDLLTSSVLTCQSHSFDGGIGKDTVSYARSDTGVRATIGGAGGPPGCGTLDRVAATNESLEGSDGPDLLAGSNGRNSLLGHLGADTLIGKGGNDFLDSADGRRDRRIDCGGGTDEASNERGDPQPIGCERLAALD
jgi:Ca2+-binding RTX toxin-like protein